MFAFSQKIAGALNGNRKTAALILAAGRSERMGGKTSKQLMEIGSIPVIAHTLAAFQAAETITEIIVAARECDIDTITEMKELYGIGKLRAVIPGGESRQESAKRALAQISPKIQYVAIADGARCLVTPDEIMSVCVKAYRTNAASAACPLTGTVKRAKKKIITGTVPRDDLWEAQTPQVFHVGLYSMALERAKEEGFDATDDNSLIEHLGCEITLVPCSPQNLKITTPDDLEIARAIYALRRAKGQALLVTGPKTKTDKIFETNDYSEYIADGTEEIGHDN